ncbi:MAG: hypothetical protein HY688_02020 [Chloroflexi bacterium]|nr:hypothetical protein [Chloroflexota bacterium]
MSLYLVIGRALPVCGLSPRASPRRGQDHAQPPRLHLGWRINARDVCYALRHPPEQVNSQLRVRGLPPPEEDRDLDLVTFLDELPDLPSLEVYIMDADLGTHPDLADIRYVLALAGLPLLLGLLIAELAVVQQAADRRLGFGRHLHEV